MSDYLCIGDFVSLYCEETEGYVYNWQSSSEHNNLYVSQWQDRDKPNNVPTPQALQFQVCIQNRYKLNKKLRKFMIDHAGELDFDSNKNPNLVQAKLAADAENEDNISEQRRQHGKRVRYGEIIQLKHVFSNKYIHVSTTQTSRRDKNNMLIYLQNFNAKHAQFRLLPRYKVKSEGEFVQVLDQIILESFKSLGQFFHASTAWKIDHFNTGSELNLGIQPAGFTVVKSSRPSKDIKDFVTGGSVIRLFHKELEAYLVAEGLYDDEVTEDVHLRIREVDQLVPKSLYPSTSGNTYWQIEGETSVLNGDVIRWEQQIRLRHMTTRQYLCITSARKVSLIDDWKDPRTVFRLHPVIKESDEISFESYSRIEHVITGYWLHALRDEEYIRRQHREKSDESKNSMKNLRWDGASLRKISASGEKMYHDAYTLQKVEDQHVRSFNFVSGMAPFLLNLIKDREEEKILNAKKTYKITTALQELKSFMLINNVASKKHQKLMRNLRIIDLLVKILKSPLLGAIDQSHLTKVFKAAYDVLYVYMIGDSRKNSLYFAKYIDFFQTQITVKIGDIGLNVAQMIVELIRDNRKIVDRISHEQIEMFVGLLKINKNYRYLDLLNVLCVCDGVAISDNQVYITEHWLRRDGSGMRFLTERGQNVNGQPNVIYVSPDNGNIWMPLHEFVDKEQNLSYYEEDVKFFQHQLDLYAKLAYGRNDFSIFVITRELGILTWDEAFLSLRSHMLPDSLRAKYCELIIALFIDVGTNYSVLDHTNLSFIYEDVLAPGPNNDGEYVRNKLSACANWISPEGIIKDLVTLFPVIRDWIAEFLEQNKDMTQSLIGRNMLIEQVLRLFHFLIKFGYYSPDDIKNLLKPLINLLNGKNDKPFLPDAEKGSYSKESHKTVLAFKTKDRFEANINAEAIVNAKFQALEVLDLLFTFQFNTRLECFIAKFKTAELTTINKKSKFQSALCPLLEESFDAFDQSKSSIAIQKKAVKELKNMFDFTAYFDSEQITSILMDLTYYKYDKMVNKSLALMNKFYSAKTKLFKSAVQAMVLITSDSCHVHREIARTMPILRRFSKAKLNDDQVKSLGAVLDRYTEFCHMAKEDDEPNAMNQNVLINHEVLSLVFDMLSIEIDAKLTDQYKGMEKILRKCLKLLKALARGNDLVQSRMFERFDDLLKIKVVEADLAIALREAFKGNQVTCLKILPQQIQTIVDLVALHLENVPEFLDLLNAIVKVEDLELTLKRNQAYVMKFLMQDYSKLAYVIDQPREYREDILTLRSEPSKYHLCYLISFIDLLATCAEGENRFIESMCQTIMSLDELLWIMNHPDINHNYKKPFLRYFLWVYMKTAGSAIESGAGDLPHDNNIWRFLRQVSEDANDLTEFLAKKQDQAMQMLKKCPSKWETFSSDDYNGQMRSKFHYFLDGVLVVVQTFYSKFYTPDKDLYPQEIEYTDNLARALLSFSETAVMVISNANHFKAIISCITAVLPCSVAPQSAMEGLIEQVRFANKMRMNKLKMTKGQKEYYQGEIELNSKLRTFAVNCSLLYGGHNTVQAQLKFKSKRAYTEIGGDEQLPLGEEFQEHLKRFVRPGEKKIQKRLELAKKLVHQLAISTSMHAKKMSESKRLEQEELDLRCLQLLRTIIHNEERKLPEDWEENPSDNKKQMAVIRNLQVELNDMGAVITALPHLAKPSDRMAKEVLAFLCIMLFNANEKIQSSLLQYFLHTREESFFAAIRNRMHLSALAIKEKRSLLAQHRARAKEVMAQSKSMLTTMAIEKKTLQEIQAVDLALKKDRIATRRKMSLSVLQSKATRKQQWLESNQINAANQKNKKKSHKQRKMKPENNLFVNKMNGVADNLYNEQLPDKLTVMGDENLLAGCGADEIEKMFLQKEKKQLKSKQDRKKFSNNLKKDGKLKQMSSSLSPQSDIYKDTVIVNIDDNHQEDDQQDLDNIQNDGMDDEDEDDLSNLDQKNGGCIGVVLRVLARMCDGQHAGLQNYLREQPDNIKSFNIVAETATFVNLVYSNISVQNIDLCVQLFETLNEFTVGNQLNRSVMLNSKVVDYINFILRAAEFSGCSLNKILSLKMSIGNLVLAMIEENTPESLIVAKEVKDTMDKEAVYRCMTQCYESCLSDRTKLDSLKGNLSMKAIQAAKDLPKFAKRQDDDSRTPELKEKLDEVGFVYYLILARIYDIDPKLGNNVNLTEMQQESFNHYRKNTMSIEILKDSNLQKINFRVKNKNVLRNEIKEKLTWNVDRSSPSNKIRDLMKWSKDILIDIYYQRKILSNPLATFLTKNWLFWNRLVIILSLVLNIFMLATWNASMSLADLPGSKNLTDLPDELYNPTPSITMKEYSTVIYSLGGAHCFFSFLVLLTYFLSNHPTLPSFSAIKQKFAKCGWKKKKKKGTDSEEEEEKEHESKLEVKFLSFTTLYYLVFLGMSVAGIVFQGYFFAFHLLNIVNNNQLLRGVIQAVTLNGKSLLWVAVLGLVVFYLYGLVSFALMRTSFDPENELYCSTLWQCTVSVVHYGLVGDIFSKVVSHPAENTFYRFGFLVLFHMSFFIFITTIGLNIIFGIIVDTFSELRNLKWTAERDMIDTCFICSRSSYDFEHHGQGFDLHINEEHCIWAYIFFFIHLHDTKKSDYTALELYVHKLLLQEKNDFFPLNRALSLSAMDEDSTESKVDELLRQIQHLVQKQKEEDARKKREEERQKQLRWKEEHRMALLQTHASMDLGGGSFGGGGSGGSGGGGIGGVAGYARGINKVTKSQYKQATRQKQWLSTNKSHAMDNILSNADAKNLDDNLASVIKKSTAFNDQQKKAVTTAMPASSSSSTVPMVPFHQQTSKSADFETFEDDDDDDDIGDENNEADDYDTLASDYLADDKNEIAKIGLSSGSLLDYPKSSRLGERQLLHYELPNKQQSIKQIMKFEPEDPFAPTVIPPLFFQSSKRSRSSSVQSALIGNDDDDDDVEDENVDDEFEISAYEPESQPDSNISKEEIKKYTKTDGRKLKPKLQTFQEILSNPLYESDSNSNTFKQMENFSSNASKHEKHKRDGASAENQKLLIQSAEQIYQPQSGDGASNQKAMSLLDANILCSAPSAAMQLNQSKLSKIKERKHLQHKKRQSLNVHDAPKLWKPIKQQQRQQPDQTSSSQPPPYNQHLEHQQKKLDVSSQQTLLLPSRRSAENVITTKAAGDGQFFQLQQHHFYPEHEQFSDSQQQKPHQTHLHTSKQTSQQHSKDVQLGDEHSLKSTAKREDSKNEEAIDDDDRIESTFV